MPELPDIVAYLDALRPRVVGATLMQACVASPFLIRTAEPPIADALGKRVLGLRRMGKRIVLEMEGELFLVFHLMIAGRFRWGKPGGKPVGKIGLAAFEFAGATIGGTLQLTEASGKKRASLHVVRGEVVLRGHDPGGLEILSEEEICAASAASAAGGERGGGSFATGGLQTRPTGDGLETRPTRPTRATGDGAQARPATEAMLAAFAAAVRRENHTIKRTLTDPRAISGVGNAYSDEILHAARMSPLTLTARMDDEAVARLLAAARGTLLRWIAVLRAEFAGRFPGPGEITAFREGFAVHGRYGKPCPVCGAAVHRIRYAANETNYCPRCQTEGRILADRSLSRLLRDDWPRTLEELE